MKAVLKALVGVALATSVNIASATVLTFDNAQSLGVTLGGSMTWNGTGGGHLYNESYGNDDSIIFSGATYVNSFQMNAMPWQGYTGGTVGNINILGLNSSNQTVWNTTVNLTGYTSWSNWLTVAVNTADIKTLKFLAPGNAPFYNGFWPSVDNLTINQPSAGVPEPTGILLLGLGLGLLGLRRMKKIVV